MTNSPPIIFGVGVKELLAQPGSDVKGGEEVRIRYMTTRIHPPMH